MRVVLSGLLCFTCLGCFGPPGTETNPKNYSSLMAQWTGTGLVAHFPNPIPPAATHIMLSSFPGHLQGGAWFQVRFTLPASDVSRIHDQATKAAKDVHDGGDFRGSNIPGDGRLPGTSFYTSDSREHGDFPADYRIFVFGARSSNGTTWNHGDSHGMVITRQRNEVIYYAETW